MAKETVNVYCPYCGAKALLVDSSEVYKQSYGFIWLCRPCNAYTGVHKSSPTFKPLGTLAKKKLRKLRQEVHALFDPIWKSKKMSRSAAYARLSMVMRIPIEGTHVSMFDEAKCHKAIRILKKYWDQK